MSIFSDGAGQFGAFRVASDSDDGFYISTTCHHVPCLISPQHCK